MSAAFFYRTYARFSKRGKRSRLKITPLGIIVFAVCIVSGTAGLNIFDTGLYRIFTLSLSLIVIAKLFKAKIQKGISVNVFFDRQYRTGEKAKYSITVINNGSDDITGLELVPEIERGIPTEDEFLKLREPGEEKRNIWDRNIYYFRWVWHILRLHKADFYSLKNISVKKDGFTSVEAEFFPLKRGIIKFTGVHITSKDIFGLFTASEFFKSSNDIVILPVLTEIERALKNSIAFSADRRNTSRSHYFLKNKSGDFIGLRDYLPGDPQKNIHWKSWAKRNRPVVIEKGLDKIKECSIILINCGIENNCEILFEDCVSYVYSTIKYLDDSGFEISFFFMTPKEKVEHFRAEKEKGNFHKLYNTIAEIEFLEISHEKYISKLKQSHDPYCPSYLFCVRPEPAVLLFAAERNITVLSTGTENLGSVKIVQIPGINKPVLELNQA